VAGIAAGKGESFSGVAPDAALIAIQVFSQFNATQCSSSVPCAKSYPSDQIKGLERIYELRTTYPIAAVNMSLGSGKYTSPCDGDPRKPIIDQLRAAGIVTVIAAGNSYYSDALGAPACISSAISVGSTGDGSGGAEVDVVSYFSNSASFLTLLAPGSVITSALAGGGFITMNGTSMAAPHVAGAWAVLKSKKPDATIDEVQAALVNTGRPVVDERNGLTKPRIQVDQALLALPTPELTEKIYFPQIYN
jgi:subtilisin family serine protease